ncbi:MAG: glycosyltransferase family 2 protein, partial [Moorea sp. SIO3G5]|nr:glycosyltransferase family 2 protein [Moorena sp. SIO3G5]
MTLFDALISIIIPCYNNQAFIKQAIESALNQTYPYTEIIVIDDGSTDGSLEIIRSFENSIKWETGSNQGAPAARNRGLELAKGEYIKFLDAD